MNQIASVVKMHAKDYASWLIIPWSILLLSFGVNLVVASFANEDIYTGGLASIYGYMIAAGALTIAQTFPFALGLSVRRTDYFWGTAGMAALVSAVSAALLLLLSIVERLTGAWGLGLHFFNVVGLGEVTALGQLAIYFAALVHMYFAGFAIASLHQRVGRIGLYVFFGTVFVLSSVVSILATHYHWWGGIGGWLLQQSVSGIVIWMVPLAAVYMLASHLLLRRATA